VPSRKPKPTPAPCPCMNPTATPTPTPKRRRPTPTPTPCRGKTAPTPTPTPGRKRRPTPTPLVPGGCALPATPLEFSVVPGSTACDSFNISWAMPDMGEGCDATSYVLLLNLTTEDGETSEKRCAARPSLS
jgi:hypothetical protein